MNQNMGWRFVEDGEIEQPAVSASSNPVIEATKAIGRHPARTLARVAETAAGLPGDLANVALSGVNLIQRPFTGKSSETIENLQQNNPFTSQSIRENITKPLEKNVLPEGYLTPQGKSEKLADDFISDITTLLMPATGAAGFAAKGGKLAKGALKSAAVTSGLGNIAGFLTKNITGSEGAGNTVKAITMLGTSLVGIPGMKQASGRAYNQVENMIPESLQSSTQELAKAMNKAENIMAPYRSTKGGKALLDYFQHTLEPITTSPETKLKSIIELDKGFNKVIAQNPSIAYDVKAAMDVVKGAIDKTIQQSGRSDIYNAYKSAKRLYSESFKAQEAHEWIQDVAKSTPKTLTKLKDTTKFLLGIPAKTKQGIEEATRQLSIPEVRRYWVQASKAALQNSRPAWIKAANMLDKKVEQKANTRENMGWRFVEDN
jgi:hypothetical protein